MSVFNTFPDSATTLSVNYRPGQNKRLLASKSEAIFSFGDFTIEKDFSVDILTGDPKNLSFGTFDNLETLRAENIDSNISKTFVQQNQLNLPKKNPKSHSYFSSFYTNIASSINKIIDEFPYAILSNNNGNINIFDYSENYSGTTNQRTSSFKIPISGLTNQGQIYLNSGDTEVNYSLAYDYDIFCVQLSGQTDVFNILEYTYSGTYLQFLVVGALKPSQTATTFTDSLYIRPTPERMNEYYNNISSLEFQLLGDAIFSIPRTDTVADDFLNTQFIWPKNIDGWAPDSYGSDFETYQTNILNAAEKVDEEKTDIFLKTVIPENYLDFDSDSEIYRTIIQSYAIEFDRLKNYIDALAYAHSIEYNNEETVPKKFMTKLGNLLGWKLSDSFSELDLFDYLTSELGDDLNSYSYFNVEIWRRILINLVWLYKRKGTRDAITFIFRLIGAPDELVEFDEFVYDITKTTAQITQKVDEDGYIQYSSSLYDFQEGGKGRGDGKNYINQWMPEFSPILRVDNEKIELGDATGGTRNIINTKEVNLGLSPAKALETDVFEYYQDECASWNWGSTCPPFSCLTVPFEFLTFDSDDVHPTNVTAMTLSQYINHVYTNSIDPTTRKTNAQCHTTWSYPELKNIYLAYYYATCPDNNKVTICKLDEYLKLLELQLGDYVLQLLPATTIVDEGFPTKYKNPVFHRERFVYKEGIDRGSMFQTSLVDHPNKIIPQCYFQNGTLCVFAKQGYFSNGRLDITGTIWRLANNIPAQNICPSAKNVNGQFVSMEKIENISTQINEPNIVGNYITTRRASINSVSLTCSINNNSISTNIAAVTVTPTNVSETSQSVISQQIFTQ